MRPNQHGKLVIEVKPHTYQPRKAERQEAVGYNASADEAVKALFRQVVVKGVK